MGGNRAVYHLHVAGAFRLTGPDGARIDVSSKRGQALIAMLATAPNGERTRAWLQDRLWCQRAASQASASLRRELSNLRKLAGEAAAETPWIEADFQRVWLNFDVLEVDIRHPDHRAKGVTATLLEGLDLAGEEAFEDWLRAERAQWEGQTVAHVAEQTALYAPPPEAAPPAAPPLADFAERPAIAVLPFTVAGQSADSAETTDANIMAQGLTEDLLDRLARLRWLPVIAHASVAGVTQGTAAPLGARYVVHGHLRPKLGGDGEAWLLSATLTDTMSGQLMWSARLDLADAGATDDLLSSIAANLGLKIDQHEQARAIGPAQGSHRFADVIGRGRWHLARLTRADAQAAQACFDEALAMNPQSAEALIQSAWVRLYDVWMRRGTEADIRDVRAMAQRAIIADYDDARGHMLAGIAEIWLRQPLRAEALLRRAVALNPSLVMAHSQLGTVLNLQGLHHDALTHLALAKRLSPNDPELFFTLGEMAVAHLFLGDYPAALDCAERSLARRGAYWFAHVIKISALVGLSDAAGAARARADLAAAKPDFVEGHIDWLPFLDPAKRDLLKAGLNPTPA